MTTSDAEWARHATTEYANGWRDAAALLNGAMAGYHGEHQNTVRAFAWKVIQALEEQAASIRAAAEETR